MLVAVVVGLSVGANVNGNRRRDNNKWKTIDCYLRMVLIAVTPVSEIVRKYGPLNEAERVIPDPISVPSNGL